MNEMLHKLADLYGIEAGYQAATGEYRHTSDETRRALLAAIGVPAGSEEDMARALSAAPEPMPADAPPAPDARAFRPDWLDHTRIWGVTCQLYGLTSRRNWGMGDFEDLARLAEIAAARGADFIGVNPLHALFPADPSRFSPYAPSSRQFLNPLYIAPNAVPEYAQAAERLASIEGELAALREIDLIDYARVAHVKGRAFAVLYGVFRRLPESHPRRRAFEAFRAAQDAALERHGLFEALGQHFTHKGGYPAWSQWPEAFRDAGSAEAAQFARANAETIAFYVWLQWVADGQLREAQARACRAGMRVGLYLDLAVGVAPDGATTWTAPEVAIAEAEIGAPPDLLGPAGQQWGLAPFSPACLKKTRLAALRDVLAAVMRNAGAVRIDHAMGLQRLFWIPKGMTAADGAYMRYPVAEMFEAVTAVSRECRCLVIGEDLGTVPLGFRDKMRASGLFGYRVLYFERAEDGRFKHSWEHEADALVCAATHDLPTLRGWWAGRDIDWRVQLGLASKEDATRQREARAHDRDLLLQALTEEGLTPKTGEPGGLSNAASQGESVELDDSLVVAIHRYIARTPCRLLAVQLEDALGVREQANLPGTVFEHPNWRRKMPFLLEELADNRLFAAVTEAVAQERPRQ